MVFSLDLPKPLLFTATHWAYVEHDLPVRLTAVGNVQILSGKVPSVQLVNVFQTASRPHLQGAHLQHFEEIIFLVAVPKRALGKNNHYNSCIAYASLGAGKGVARMSFRNGLIWLPVSKSPRADESQTGRSCTS
ncbi:hypothetical protein SBA4_5090012 [Candidatus Sulfopaludibacter sp. SbA4]|nr:hypothetical protein SBA4_5090012 [Candidatus Sulfopaludibacter sp. SbA4]